MIDVSPIFINASELRDDPSIEEGLLRKTLLRRLHLPPDDVVAVELRKRSVDGRRGHPVRVVCTLRVQLRGGRPAEDRLVAKLSRRRGNLTVRIVEKTDPGWADLLPPQTMAAHHDRPVVVGAGCAGLFCALALARAGLEPLLVERGDDARRRTEAVATFDATGILDPQSNIQFGVGGAGTFSDGKLSTGTKNRFHRLILETFVAAGASESILWDAKPHIGSDVLPRVVDHMVAEIRSLGGEVRFRTTMVSMDIQGAEGHRAVTAVDLADGDGRIEKVPCQRLILASGHSARDVFALLEEQGVPMEPKTFAMGVRIEHLQSTIDKAQWGADWDNPALGPSPYKLVAKAPSTGRSAYSFCMCPGGFVVAAASEPGGVVTNGMSLSDRAGVNANAGLLVNVEPEDLPSTGILAGIELQRACEKAAFDRGGGAFRAPAQRVGDFLAGVPSEGPGSVLPTYPRGVTWTTIDDGLLPAPIIRTLREALPILGRKLRGYDQVDAVLTGVESRSSSPIRVVRDRDCQSTGVQGLFPLGEGAGYAGGIMSAATDGLRGAAAVVASLAR